MNREFLDLYNRELLLLYEQAKEFAEEYPEIAQRLGGLVAERTDPMVAGLLEGTAFLAARVQLKMKHEFPEFTGNLLEQLMPGALAPTPSAVMVRFTPKFGDAALKEGRVIPRLSIIEAVHAQKDNPVACRFRLSSNVTLWPFEISNARYFAAAAPLQALRVPLTAAATAGLVLTLRHRSVANAANELAGGAAPEDESALVSTCRTRRLPIHFLGPEADAIALLEQIFARRVSLHFRYLDSFGDPVILPGAGVAIRPVGFGEDEALLPVDHRLFRGFDLLREYFILPRKFLGIELAGLETVLPRIRAAQFEIVLAFSEANARLPAYAKPENMVLYAAPAVNLFEKTTDRLPVKPGLHEYHVVPDRSRPLDYEPHRILAVHAHRPGGKEKRPVPPLYGAALDNGDPAELAYTLRRLPRRRTADERRYGTASEYTGTEMFLSISTPLTQGEDRVMELSVRALCSNRHLPELLPVGSGKVDFRLLDDTELAIACIAGPTPPREPIAGQKRGRAETWSTGSTLWRLLNLASLNHLGFASHNAAADARMLKETLRLFADSADSATERRIAGLRAITSQPVVRRVQRREGAGVARGIEIGVTIDEAAFEGSGIFLLGAILDEFFAEYAHLNTFTQMVLRSTSRGEVMRFAPRLGRRAVL
ncbi:type VI secretion system baseplate subunit TssF [Rhabdaerophilum calidifontis]|uniref:type VI secretion system baseplate subunit TssF n=1 Tax=Rhabdaerophilum calidifontis TaxID=2604328 RepID=UPI00123A1A46|nr:type VI secretion system baseplate subunit TssF [Rhabdaerophilum calidifontis]